ncbi:MAG: hypothetical protein AAF367_05420 [Pseudomonadota bacterium]
MKISLEHDALTPRFDLVDRAAPATPKSPRAVRALKILAARAARKERGLQHVRPV